MGEMTKLSNFTLAARERLAWMTLKDQDDAAITCVAVAVPDAHEFQAVEIAGAASVQ